MGLIEEILNYYSFYSLQEIHKGQYQSVQDCMDYLSKKGADLQLRTFLGIIKKFENDGFLLKIGQKGDDPIYGATYVAQTLSQDYLEYGSYHFHYYGFSSIRTRFTKSVLPIDVTLHNDSKDIGTCFIVDSHRILTAKHCIENKKNIKILDPMGQVVKPNSIWIPDDHTDIAMIEMGYYNFSSCPKFKIEFGEVLEEVLTMGYPPIPGFDAVQIADVSHIGGAVKVSKGKIVAEHRTLWMKSDGSYDSTDAQLYYSLCASGTLYEYIASTFNITRPEAKTNMLELAFSSHRNPSPFRKIFKASFPTVLNHIDSFKKKNAKSSFFAVELQSLESEIFVDNLYVTMKEQGLFCITKHDSLLIREHDQDTVMELVTFFFKHIEMDCTLRIDDKDWVI